MQMKCTAGEEVEEEGEKDLHFQEACLVLSNKQVGQTHSEEKQPDVLKSKLFSVLAEWT